jgi:hypothetical protein
MHLSFDILILLKHLNACNVHVTYCGINIYMVVHVILGKLAFAWNVKSYFGANFKLENQL